MPRRDKTFKSHKDRRLQTLDRKRAKNYMANLLQKYKPLVPEHVDFVKGPEPEKRAFKLVANDVEAIAKDPKNGGDIAKVGKANAVLIVTALTQSLPLDTVTMSRQSGIGRGYRQQSECPSTGGPCRHPRNSNGVRRRRRRNAAKCCLR